MLSQTPFLINRLNRKMILEATQLTRRYNGNAVVKALSLTLDKGEIVGLLGPNGAGKSTLLQMLAGVLAPSQGTVQIFGRNPLQQASIRKHLGYLPEQPPLYPDFTVREQLDFACQLQQMDSNLRQQRIAQVMQNCELKSVEKHLNRHLSKGLRHRVGLAQALLHHPSILLLDEPTDGLDPLQTQNFQQLIGSLKTQAGVIISTHNLHEVEALCDRVLIMNQGRLLLSATLSDLLKTGDTLEQAFTRLIYSGQTAAA